MASVAIVILNYNGKKFLQQFMPSVLATTYSNISIIVADNASTDDSVEFLSSAYPHIQLLRSTINEGFAKGYNTALKQIHADYFMLLNSDVEVTPEWIEPMIDLMEHDSRIAACQPKLRSHAEKNKFEYSGACGGWIDRYGYPFCRGRMFDEIEEDHGQYDDAQPVFWASGAALMIRSEVYRTMNGFDEHFFAHQEEIDLCWRIQLAGWKVYVQPKSLVYHVGGGTLPRGNSRKVYLNFRNNMIMMAKNLPLGKAIPKLMIRSALDELAAFKYLVGGDLGSCFAVIKAQFAFLKWLFVGRKKALMPLSRKGSLSGLYRGSIVWQHFMKKKKRFSEIVNSKT
jgi:GT2 family glycosyltransferase